MKKILLIIVFALWSPFTVAAQEAAIYLVRHAEKQADSDPELTEYGYSRAAALAAIMKDVSLAKVYSTDTRRTRQTAQPTAEQKELGIEIYDPRAFSQFAETLKTEFLSSGKSILVVGHSNTTPYLATLLTGDSFPELREDQYDHLYVLTKTPDGELKATITKFNP
ncbi:MAG: histidine phosphatase family protein [Kordiimonadaceae bacterium]|nr:histidine phosphatase family protein [Kordiimonadaceae bacterium]MBO6570576.1 histidine phosphatase family protein [Kordiimonadaceae bacterium]MBO6966566.1 histidine phosphatase family protein [Kordiimonadaceae bacterium]